MPPPAALHLLLALVLLRPLQTLVAHPCPLHSQVIRVSSPSIRKPPGILWERLSPQKLGQIRILQQLKRRIEEEQGCPLPTGPDEVLPPVAQRGQRRGGGGGRGGGRGSGRGGGRGGRGRGAGDARQPGQRGGGQRQPGRGQERH